MDRPWAVLLYLKVRKYRRVGIRRRQCLRKKSARLSQTAAGTALPSSSGKVATNEMVANVGVSDSAYLGGRDRGICVPNLR